MEFTSNEYGDAESKLVRRQQVDGLLLSIPILILVGTLIISAISTTELLGWRLSKLDGSYLKFLPLLTVIVATMIVALSLPPKRLVYYAFSSISVNKFLTAFFIMAFPGSFYARFVLNKPFTYFSQAIMLITFFCSFFIFRAIPTNYWIQVRSWIVRTFGILTIVAATAVLLNLTKGLDKTKSDAVLILVQGVALIYYWKFGPSRIVLLFLSLGLTLLTFKNTAILLLLIFSFCFYLFPKTFLRKFSIFKIIGLFVVGVIASLTLAGLYFWLQSQFSGYSDGNTAFRTILYEYRLNQFVSSPIVGQLFTGETAYQFEYFFNGITVPTHSDWIDILAQGGVIGFLFFLGIFARICRLLIRLRRHVFYSERNSSNLASWLLLFIICVLVSSLFNSTFNSPDISFIFWVALAFAHRLVQIAQTPGLKQVNAIYWVV